MPFSPENDDTLSLQGLLQNQEGVEFKENRILSAGLERRTQKERAWRIWTIVHMSLICIYSTVFFAIFIGHLKVSKDGRAPPLPLPARHALKPETRYFLTELEGNPFAGAPRPELEEAWHQLLQNDNIRIPRTELEQLGISSVYTKDGTAAIASLSVFHSLHCLKLVRRMMYKEYYHVNKSTIDMQRQIKHADHCVEYLRETLMCKPDISLVTFRWINNTAQHPDQPASFYPTNFDVSPHECMSWGALNEWAGQRVFDLYDVDSLDRPMS